MGKKSKGKQKNMDSVVKPLIADLFQKCVNPTGGGTPSPKELFSAHKEIAEMLQSIEKHKGEGKIPQLPRRDGCIKDFCVWAKEQNIIFEGVGIKPIRDSELAIFASHEFAKGDIFIKVPRSAMMASDCLKGAAIGSLVQSDPLLSSMPNVALAVHLLSEVYKMDSKWRPYINILPRHYTNILYFDTSDIENLKGTSTFLHALNTVRSIVRQYAYLCNLFYKHPVAKELGLADNFTYADYRWAVATLMTRQNPIPSANGSTSQVIALIPFLDLCNHKEGPVSIDYNPKTKECDCFVMEPVKAGDEILIHYGPRPNSELVIYNGFFYQNNSHDVVKMKLCLSKSDPNHEIRQKLITKLGLEDSLPIGCIPSPIKDSLWAFLLTANLNEDELKEISQSDATAIAEKLYSGISICTETKAKGLRMLKDRCDICSRVIPDVDDAMKKLYEDGQLTCTGMLSLSLKMNEKRLLQEAMSFIESELKSLQSS